MGDQTIAVTLQNGLGNLEVIGDVLGQDRVLLGMTYIAAAAVGPGAEGGQRATGLSGSSVASRPPSRTLV